MKRITIADSAKLMGMLEEAQKHRKEIRSLTNAMTRLIYSERDDEAKRFIAEAIVRGHDIEWLIRHLREAEQ